MLMQDLVVYYRVGLHGVWATKQMAEKQLPDTAAQVSCTLSVCPPPCTYAPAHALAAADLQSCLLTLHLPLQQLRMRCEVRFEGAVRKHNMCASLAALALDHSLAHAKVQPAYTALEALLTSSWHMLAMQLLTMSDSTKVPRCLPLMGDIHDMVSLGLTHKTGIAYHGRLQMLTHAAGEEVQGRGRGSQAMEGDVCKIEMSWDWDCLCFLFGKYLEHSSDMLAFPTCHECLQTLTVAEQGSHKY